MADKSEALRAHGVGDTSIISYWRRCCVSAWVWPVAGAEKSCIRCRPIPRPLCKALKTLKPLQISWSFKLMDGIRVHEETKVHLLTYAEQTGQKPVKPFMLVIARDTTHATGLLTTIEGLFDGQYGQGNSGR